MMFKISMRCAWLVTTLMVITVPMHAQPDAATIMQTVQTLLSRIYAISTADFVTALGLDTDEVPTITADELSALMQQQPDLLVINVLTERWYLDCHIPGSINIPLHELPARIANLDPDQTIVMYCALDACNGGHKATLLLRALGFSRVVDYPGGIKDWFVQGYPVAGPCAESYLHEPYLHRSEAIDAIC